MMWSPWMLTFMKSYCPTYLLHNKPKKSCKNKYKITLHPCIFFKFIYKFTNGEWRGNVTLYVVLQDVRLDFACFELHRFAWHKQILSWAAGYCLITMHATCEHVWASFILKFNIPGACSISQYLHICLWWKRGFYCKTITTIFICDMLYRCKYHLSFFWKKIFSRYSQKNMLWIHRYTNLLHYFWHHVPTEENNLF